MTDPNDSPPHITTTETVLRLYVLLAQYLDRCVDDAIRDSLSDKDFQRHLSETRTKVADLLTANRVVKEKVEKEYEDVLKLGDDYLKHSREKSMRSQVEKEQEVLRVKLQALSDLLAVFRSI